MYILTVKFTTLIFILKYAEYYTHMTVNACRVKIILNIK